MYPSVFTSRPQCGAARRRARADRFADRPSRSSRRADAVPSSGVRRNHGGTSAFAVDAIRLDGVSCVT
ncbi:hypothetical protein FRAAL1657 [Frankia alni ACN14a]|uniref:Uncharacterized protein n=1 Tax=Frankia alni (strain DSM 45986 / CECT 9034 / ACN14a) TaxID=326424 RepID=Q0RQ65_FRAAA|nr:hypothetical protein FRAAL1657 [Frankia alni ACN14a]